MAGKVNVPISVAIQGIAKTQAQLSQLGKGVSSVGKTAGLAAAGFALFAGAVKSADFAVQAIAGARDLERNMAGLKTVFDEVTPQMKTFSANAVQMGLSLNEASKSSTFIGSVLKQSGFDIQQTADLTERLVGLATDLSITYGYDVQEALLGMTALFRGEYDPIEKFGVAMKQSEINSELAARGLDGLTGAARRFEEQQIRVDLLFQRSADAQGAFQRQSGTLATEQLKLAASFANMRDTVAVNLLPVMASLMESLRETIEVVGPELKRAFDISAPVLQRFADDIGPIAEDLAIAFVEALKELIRFIRYIQDNWNWISVLATTAGTAAVSIGLMTAALGAAKAAQEAFNVVVNRNPYVLAATALIAMAGGMQAVTSQVEETEPYLEQLHGTANSIANDFDKKFTPGAYAAAAETYRFGKYMEFLRGRILEVQKTYTNTTNLEGILKASNLTMADFKPIEPEIADSVSTGGTQKITDYVGDFMGKIAEEVKKQRARLQLETMGAPEGLIDQILSSEGWMKIWLQIKQGVISLADLEKQYYKTAAGAKELEDAQEAAKQAWIEYDAAVAAVEESLAKELASIAEHFDDVRLSFSDMIAEFSVLNTIEREIGQFEGAVADYADSIRDSLKQAFRAGDLLEAGYKQLQAYADKELALLAEIQRKRDELATKYSLSESLIKEYRSAFTSVLNLTTLFGNLSEEAQTRTVNEVSKGVVQLGSDLRAFNVTVTRSYEETLDSVSSKSQGLLDGFREMADKARAFADNLRKLRDLGLDPMLFNQLVEAGVEAGGETAQALVDGGSATISEINALFQEIDAVGAQLGFDVSETYYDSGQALIDALLAGMRSQQAVLEQQAKDFAKSFNDAFQANLDIATGAAQTAQEEVARQAAKQEIAAIPVPTVPKPVDQAALNQLDALIKKAGSYATNISDATKAAGALVKQDIYQQLRDTVAAGGTVDLSGISSGMSSADLAQAAAKASGGSVTYNVNVTADTRLSGAKAGEAVVQALSTFQNANGTFTSYLT
jgi:hypothetical protein